MTETSVTDAVEYLERNVVDSLPKGELARKLAKVAWSLVTHGTTYDPDRVHTQPAPRPPAVLTEASAAREPPSSDLWS